MKIRSNTKQEGCEKIPSPYHKMLEIFIVTKYDTLPEERFGDDLFWFLLEGLGVEARLDCV